DLVGNPSLIVGRGRGTGTILDIDATPSLSIDDASSNEGGTASFVLHLSQAVGKIVTVRCDTADGSATAASGDYTALSNIVVAFAPGDVQATVPVALLD